MTTAMEAIKQEEERLGRALSPVERMALLPAGQRLGSKDDEDYAVIFQETKEGINLHEEMQKRKALVEGVQDVNERHRLAHWFSNQKQLLLRQFRNNELTRLKPKTD